MQEGTTHPRLSPEDIKEALERRDALLQIRALIGTSAGKEFIKYLFKTLGVTDLPAQGLEGAVLMEALGYLRAGNMIFKLVAEADAKSAGSILAEIEKEKYVQAYADSNIGRS